MIASAVATSLSGRLWWWREPPSLSGSPPMDVSGRSSGPAPRSARSRLGLRIPRRRRCGLGTRWRGTLWVLVEGSVGDGMRIELPSMDFWKPGCLLLQIWYYPHHHGGNSWTSPRRAAKAAIDLSTTTAQIIRASRAGRAYSVEKNHNWWQSESAWRNRPCTWVVWSNVWHWFGMLELKWLRTRLPCLFNNGLCALSS